MKLLKELRDSEKDLAEEDYEIRESARAVVIRDGKIAILSVSKYGYHKLPGGGLEKEEDVRSTLLREIKEETGCDAEIIEEIGKIVEYKSKFKQKQISYCYLVKVKSYSPNLRFTDNEKSAGFSLLWEKIDNAIKLFENDAPLDYFGKLIRNRPFLSLNFAITPISPSISFSLSSLFIS